MTLLESLADLRSGKIDPISYVSSFCERIESEESKIQAIVPGTFDRSRVLRDANRQLEAFPEPNRRPSLFGVPVGVKDIFRCDGFPTRCGSALPPELFAGPEADCIQRLKKAGAIIMAKTVTTEFAYNEPGPTRNPYDLQRTPGGSSSGSAAGVASGFFPFALGSQTVGSVIRPAAFCGVVGFKPSFGRISTAGVIPYSTSADHVGIFCREPSAVETILSAMTAEWKPKRIEKPLQKAIFGIPEGPYLERATPNGIDFFNRQMNRLRQAGYVVRPFQAFSDFHALAKEHRRLIAAEMARFHAPWFEAHRRLYRPRTREQIELGLSISDSELDSLRSSQIEARETIEKQMKDDGIDFWICPPATDHAPRGLESTGDAVMNLPWTSAGLPAVTLPAGLDGAGLPQGIQMIGRFMDDEILIRAAEEIFFEVLHEQLKPNP